MLRALLRLGSGVITTWSALANLHAPVSRRAFTLPPAPRRARSWDRLARTKGCACRRPPVYAVFAPGRMHSLRFPHRCWQAALPSLPQGRSAATRTRRWVARPMGSGACCCPRRALLLMRCAAGRICSGTWACPPAACTSSCECLKSRASLFDWPPQQGRVPTHPASLAAATPSGCRVGEGAAGLLALRPAACC